VSYNVGVEAGPWTGLDEFRLRLVTRACELRLWIRLCTLAGLPGRALSLNTWDEEYNSGSGKSVITLAGGNHQGGRGRTNMRVWPTG